MQISHYNSLLYIFVGIVASAAIYFSHASGEGKSSFFYGGKSSFWLISALSFFAGSIVQFWILLLPVLSLSHPAILVILSLIISVFVPIFLLKNRNTILNRFMELLSQKLKTIIFIVVVIFFVFIQPFALLYLGEKIIAQFFGGSYHFLLVFLIGISGLTTLIGGKKVVAFANAMFGVTVIVAALVIMYLGNSVSAPLMFLQMLFTDGAQYFQNNNFVETNWIIGFIGFSIITWWMWWIDNSAFHLQGKQSEQRNSNAVMFASFSLIVIALVVFPEQSFSGTAPADARVSTSVMVNNELLSFFFVLGVVSVMVSAFSHSFQNIASIVIVQFFHEQVQQSVEEKHILVARLVIVLSALLTILYIPFAQLFGAITLLVYVQYLACFAASIVGVFTVFVLWKNYNKRGVATGIIGGMTAGIIVVVLTYSGSEMLTPLLATPYGAAAGIFLFSMVCSVGGSILVERKITKRSVVV
ncbi:MAG TPA: hypothetical protein DCQ28_14320 [Bacteroidetes bacterium]|nr:hypothetical protein [Bacteroidota bacterium]